MKGFLCMTVLFISMSCKQTDPEPPTPINFPGTYKGRYYTRLVDSGDLINDFSTTTITSTTDPTVFQFTDDHLHSFRVKLTTVDSSNAYKFIGLGNPGTLESDLNGSFTNSTFNYYASGISQGKRVSVQVGGSKQ